MVLELVELVFVGASYRDPTDVGRDTCVSSLMHRRAILATAVPTEGYLIVIVTLTDFLHCFLPFVLVDQWV